MSKINEVNNILYEQLLRISNTNLSKEDLESEIRRGGAINSVAGNIIKISSLSLQAVELKIRCKEMDLSINENGLPILTGE